MGSVQSGDSMSNEILNPPVMISPVASALQAVAQTISERQPLNDIFQVITNALREVTCVSTVAVGVQKPGTTLLQIEAVSGPRTRELAGLHIETNLSIARRAFDADFILPKVILQTSGEPILLAPIRQNDVTVGAIILMEEASSDIPEETIELVSPFVLLAEMAMSWAKLEKRVDTQTRELQALYSSASSVGGSLNIQNVLNSVLEAATSQNPDASAIVFLLNDDRSHLFIAAETGLTDEEREVQLSMEDPLPVRVLESGASLLLPRTGPLSLLEPLIGGDRLQCAMVAPIRVRNDSLGLVVVFSQIADVFHHTDLRLLSASAAQAGVAIGNALLYEDMTRRAEESTALFDISGELGTSLNRNQICHLLADNIRSLIFTDQVAVLVPDNRVEKTNRLTVGASWGIAEDDLEQFETTIGEGIAGWVFEWMTPTAVADVAVDARNYSSPIHGAGVTSVICVPIASGDKVNGVILAMTKHRRLFTVGEVELLFTIANQAGGALENARRYEEARFRSTQLRKYFLRLAQSIGANLPGESAPVIIADLVREAMSADGCVLYRLVDDCLIPTAWSGIRNSVVSGAQIPLGGGLAGAIAQRGRGISISDLVKDPRGLEQDWIQREHIVSYLGIPLKVDRKVVGVIEIGSQVPREFMRDEATLLSKFVSRSNVATILAGLNDSENCPD